MYTGVYVRTCVQSDRDSRHTGTALCMRAVGRLRPARASGADSPSWALSTSGHGHAAVCQVPRVPARRGLETYIGPRVARTYAVALGPNVALSVPLVTLHHSQSLRRPTGPLMSHFNILEAACLAVPRLRGRACRLPHCRLGDVSIALERRATQLFGSPRVHPHRFSLSRRDAVSFSRSTQPSLAGLRMSNLAWSSALTRPMCLADNHRPAYCCGSLEPACHARLRYAHQYRDIPY